MEQDMRDGLPPAMTTNVKRIRYREGNGVGPLCCMRHEFVGRSGPGMQDGLRTYVCLRPDQSSARSLTVSTAGRRAILLWEE